MNTRQFLVVVGLVLVVGLVYGQPGGFVLAANSNDANSDSTTSEPTTPQDSTTTTTPAPTSANATATATTTTTTTSTTTTTTTTTAKPVPRNPYCPEKCSCTRTEMNCAGCQLTQLPKMDAKNLPFTEFIFTNNSLTSIDFKQLPLSNIVTLELTNNQINSIAAPTRKQNELSKLKSLDLAGNQLESLANFSQWKMPVLRELVLSRNRFERINATDFNLKPSIEQLNLNRLSKLKSIDEAAFVPLPNLAMLNMINSTSKFHLPDQLFATNQDLYSLDLSNNNLIEVPAAIRSTNSITHLYLNGNSMTSLRQSDFINQTNLKWLEIMNCDNLIRIDPKTFSSLPRLTSLILSNNKRLSEISPLLFKRSSSDYLTQLFEFDISNNNLTTLEEDIPNLAILTGTWRLDNNPWHCDCSLKWFLNATKHFDQRPLHCASPSKYKDLEVSQALPMINCQPVLEESMMQRFVLIVFLLFLIVLTVAVFVQRADICRRLQWRDQYGTIYYTKASFPTEQV